MLAVALTLLPSTSASAIDPPTIATTPVDGGVYILVNHARPNSFWSTTAWDGSFYLLNYNESNWRSAAFTAHKDDTGWYFMSTDSTYLGYNLGDANLKGNLKAIAHYDLQTDDKYPGFYRIVSGKDQTNQSTVGLPIHLNSGGQYVVSTFDGNPWFPDYLGDCVRDTATNTPIPDEATGWIIPKDNNHEYWAFADTAAVAAYHSKIQLYTDVQSLADSVSVANYGTGYQGLVDALTNIYNRDNYGDADLAEAEALIAAKQALRDIITRSQAELGTATDATLSAAITAAIDAFNSDNTTDKLTASTQTLTDALSAYKQGQGDITFKVQNPSFEDMTAQGGSQTSGIGATPTGWKAYANGKEIATADEIRAAGINGWYGINSDADGTKDGDLVFGIWNSSIPAYELSQTITGLDNGTYSITAGLMAGANGNGSRLTSQRIFGNLNSTLFGAEDNYDASQLPDEVLTFAGNPDVATDRTLVDVTVDAYVYDGTLTFGLKTDGNLKTAKRVSSNPAGGDGWFKVDNFRIVSKGYVKDDALKIFNRFSSELFELQEAKMEESVLNDSYTLSDKYQNVTSESTPDEINAAIIAYKNGLPAIIASKNLYQSLSEAITKHYSEYNKYKAYAGADKYLEAINAADDGYQNGTLDADGVAAAIKAMDDALDNCKKNGVNVGGDVTNLITNPSFEDLSAQGGSSTGGMAGVPTGWTLKVDSTEYASGVTPTFAGNWCGINEGDPISVEVAPGDTVKSQPVDGTHLWGIWASTMPSVELSQTITGLPKGTYLLKANVMVQNSWAGSNLTTQRIFANDCVEMWASGYGYDELPADAQKAWDIDQQGIDTLKHLTYAGYVCEGNICDLLRPMQVRFGVQDDGIMKIGFRSEGDGGTNGHGWFKIDNFRLTYESADAPVNGIKGIKDGTSSEIVSREYFTLDGQKVSAPVHGVVIVKNHLSDGSVKVSKEIIK